MIYEYFDAMQVMGDFVEVKSEEAVFTSPLPSPAPRALSRSSSLASNGSASPSHQVNGAGGSSAGPKQIFVKVRCGSHLGTVEHSHTHCCDNANTPGGSEVL